MEDLNSDFCDLPDIFFVDGTSLGCEVELGSEPDVYEELPLSMQSSNLVDDELDVCHEESDSSSESEQDVKIEAPEYIESPVVKTSNQPFIHRLDIKREENSSGSEIQVKTETTECNKPPLTMQSSNLPSDNGLDNRHDGGGNETSIEDSADPVKQEQKVSKLNNFIITYKLNLNSENSASKCSYVVSSSSPFSTKGKPHLSVQSFNPPIEDRLQTKHNDDSNYFGSEVEIESETVECNKPSFTIQSPILPIEDCLDIKHDGNGSCIGSEIEVKTESVECDQFKLPCVVDSYDLPFEDKLDIKDEGSDSSFGKETNTSEDIKPPITVQSSDLIKDISNSKHDKEGILGELEVETAKCDEQPLTIKAIDSQLDIKYDGESGLEVEENSVKCKESFFTRQSSIEDRLNIKYSEDDSSPESEIETAECDKPPLETAECDKPPLTMLSPNLPIENGLDNMHDGGGSETSEDDSSEPPMKKRKVDDSSAASKDDKINTDSENSVDKSLYDGFHYSLSKEDKLEQFPEVENDKITDILDSAQSGLMEFDILDEFESNDNDNDEDEDESTDSDSDISLGELDAMLEASLQNTNNSHKDSPIVIDDLQHETKDKIVLKALGRDHFDVLPEGWVEVTHNSGMPIYLHKSSRVCCVSKPYFLGPGSTRKHEIPVSAIPCLHYLRELEKERKAAQEEEERSENHENFPSAKLESVRETKESGSLNSAAFREYCQKRFEFQTITVKRFKTWASRRKHQKQVRLKQRPSLPDSTKLITCPLPSASDKASTAGTIAKKEFIMNPSGKSPVCILHEYVQHTLRVQPRYIFKELENASTPYGAVVMINDMEYGSGYGSSKKQAKSEAAKSALEVLIPKMKMFPPEDSTADEQQDVEFFDQVRVEDPRVSDLSVKAGQPYPFQILLECLKRNYGMGDTEIYFTMRNLKHQRNEFIMKVGKHSVAVICKNKRDGKHRASQAILQLLHPHITSWGSLLRMYGKGSCKTLKEKKEEEQRITELQSQACANKPNNSILNKLKEEMLKYREKMKMKKPIGKLIPEQMELSTSDSNLKNVEL